jgi:hypothetical protein
MLQQEKAPSRRWHDLRVFQPREVFGLPRVLLRLQELVSFPKDGIDRLRRAGIQTEPAAFQTAGWIESVRWSRKPGTGGADWDTDGLVSAAVGMADEVIADDHHRFDSFEEALRKDLEHILFR